MVATTSFRCSLGRSRLSSEWKSDSEGDIEREKARAKSEEREGRMGWVWLQAALPLGIIAGMLNVMGNAQYYIHKAAHGRPKHVGNDLWDLAMEKRDKKLMESSAAAN